MRVGHRIDYKVEEGAILIAAISSSIMTPLDRSSDDENFDQDG